jgi:Spy/CpxP family protein refolding chaperone
MSRPGIAVLVGLAFAASPLASRISAVSAQEPAPPTVQGSSQGDPLFQALFPPELIMQHRRAIGLTDEQRDAISQLIQELQGRVVRLQWELLDEMQQLTEVMSAPRIDLDRALDQLDDVLETEKQIKQAHLEMLARIKNLLTPDQQATLERLRSGPGA